MKLVKQSLLLCIAVLLLLIGLQGAQSLWQLSTLSRATGEVVDSQVFADRVVSVRERFLNVQKAYQSTTAMVDVSSTVRNRDEFERQVNSLNSALAHLQGFSSPAVEEDRRQVVASVQQWLRLATAHVSGEPLSTLPSPHRLIDAEAHFQLNINTLLQDVQAQVKRSVEIGQSASQWAKVVTLVVVVSAVALGTGLGWFSLGNLHRTVGGDVSKVAELTNAIADGNLTFNVNSVTVPEGSILAGIMRMQSSLQKTISRVLVISDSVSIQSGLITRNGQTLESMASEQSSAIGTTSSLMKSLGVSVQQNANSTGQASERATRTSQAACLGEQIVSQAVETMHAVDEGSRKVTDILGVIDSIALQTNVLALNAAVEAARAGAQGRGFAVVASEVRSLAQNSAQAAQEIKKLIAESAEQVREGRLLVEKAGTAMQAMVSEIDELATLMNDVRLANDAQSQSVRDVGGKVALLDEANRNSSQWVSESTKAAELLRASSEDLLSTISFFRAPNVNKTSQL